MARLVNVRLDPERIRKAQFLRERGMTLSDVLREAIDERFAAHRQVAAAPDVNALIERLFERHPDPPDLSPRGYDVHDRRASRIAIARTMRMRRP